MLSDRSGCWNSTIPGYSAALYEFCSSDASTASTCGLYHYHLQQGWWGGALLFIPCEVHQTDHFQGLNKSRKILTPNWLFPSSVSANTYQAWWRDWIQLRVVRLSWDDSEHHHRCESAVRAPVRQRDAQSEKPRCCHVSFHCSDKQWCNCLFYRTDRSCSDTTTSNVTRKDTAAVRTSPSAGTCLSGFFFLCRTKATRGTAKTTAAAALEDAGKVINFSALLFLPRLLPQSYSWMQRNVFFFLLFYFFSTPSLLLDLGGLPERDAPSRAALFSIHCDTLKVHHVSWSGAELQVGEGGNALDKQWGTQVE